MNTNQYTQKTLEALQLERLQKLEEKIKEGGMLTSEEALWLLEEAPFEELCVPANLIIRIRWRNIWVSGFYPPPRMRYMPKCL